VLDKCLAGPGELFVASVGLSPVDVMIGGEVAKSAQEIVSLRRRKTSILILREDFYAVLVEMS
jgi:hypothetical protein